MFFCKLLAKKKIVIFGNLQVSYVKSVGIFSKENMAVQHIIYRQVTLLFRITIIYIT